MQLLRDLGGIGLSREDFCFFLLTHLSNSSAHWDGKFSALEGSRKQNCSRVSITSVSHRCTEGWRHEPENTLKVENSFIWFCLVGIGRMEEWELGMLLLLCPWNRAPSLLPSCSCGVALRTGSNTPSHSVLVFLDSNTLIYFFIFLLNFFFISFFFSFLPPLKS